MLFKFDEERAAQAAAVLLRLSGGRQNYTWLLKVLYLADRMSLAETGSPISGARFCNMKNGPLASDIYNCIKKEDGRGEVWTKYIQRDGQYFVELVRNPGDDELSDFDIEVLTALFHEHKNRTFRDMIDLVHKLGEWENPGETSETIIPESILKAAGVPSDRIQEFQEHNSHLRRVDAKLS